MGSGDGVDTAAGVGNADKPECDSCFTALGGMKSAIKKNAPPNTGKPILARRKNLAKPSIRFVEGQYFDAPPISLNSPRHLAGSCSAYSIRWRSNPPSHPLPIKLTTKLKMTVAMENSAQILLRTLSTEPKTAQFAPITASDKAKLLSVNLPVQ